MTKAQITLSPEVIEALRSAEVTANHLQLGGQLDRKLYLKVAAVIEALGGKWHRKAGLHVFEHDATDAIEDAIATGAVTDLRKLYQFYETPPEIAAHLVELGEVRRGMRVLEPSAGKGAIVQALVRAGVSPDVCELWKENRDTLLAHFELEVVAEDFLKLRDVEPYDRIIANPPFAGQQDIKHVEHMISLLAPGGILVAVMSPRWTCGEDRVSRNFRAAVNLDAPGDAAWRGILGPGKWTPLPEGSFKVSGTGVRAGILKLQKAG